MYEPFVVFDVSDDLGGGQKGVAIWCSDCRVYSMEFDSGTPITELLDWAYDHLEWCGKDRV